MPNTLRLAVAGLSAFLINPALSVTVEAADLSVFPQATITLDGLDDDWAGIVPMIVDPQESMQSDASLPASQDITAVYMAIDDDYVYCRIDVAGRYDLNTAQDSGPTVMFSNGNNDLVWTNVQSRVWMTTNGVSGVVFKFVNGIEVPWNERPQGDGAVIGGIAEMRIPRSAFADIYVQTLSANYYRGGESNSDVTNELLLRNAAWLVTEIYVATLGYAPDQEGLQYWINNLQDSGWTPTEVAQSFFDAPIVQDLYPAEQGDDSLIEALYQNIFGRAADVNGKAYWLEQLESGMVTRNQMIIALINGGWDNPEAANDMARFGNLVRVGLAFSAVQAERGILYSQLSAEKQAELRELGAQVLKGVTADFSTRNTAILGIFDLLNTLPQSDNTSLEDGLVSYYLFEGDVTDSSGNGHHGKSIGAMLATDFF
jgi:hypothetical protein